MAARPAPKRRLATLLLWLLIAATLCFILGNSLQNRDESQARSLLLAESLRPVLEPIVGRGAVTDHLIRKTAHFTEFFLLGCEITLLLPLRRRLHLQGAANCLFAGLAAAVADEGLQLISARGAQVQDVLLDYSGYAGGLLLVLALCAVFRPHTQSRSRKP